MLYLRIALVTAVFVIGHRWHSRRESLVHAVLFGVFDGLCWPLVAVGAAWHFVGYIILAACIAASQVPEQVRYLVNNRR